MQARFAAGVAVDRLLNTASDDYLDLLWRQHYTQRRPFIA